MSSTQIPAPRVKLSNPDTGEISREWYRYFLLSVEGLVDDSTEFLGGISNIASDTVVTNTMIHLMCSGNSIIYLQPFLRRSSVLSITNIGADVITIVPYELETIKGESSIELDFQWTTVQLCPKSGGYAII